MRVLAFLFLLALVGTVGIFAYQNNESVSLDFLSWHGTASMAAVLGGVFVMGMLGGWSLLGAVRRSLYRVSERQYR
jgi:lipopolysaccharide assembly protein A